jgi:hypothetical protein
MTIIEYFSSYTSNTKLSMLNYSSWKTKYTTRKYQATKLTSLHQIKQQSSCGSA